MAAVATIDQTYALNDTTQSTQIVRGTITLSGNYGSASSHGDTLALNLYGVQSATILQCLIFEEPAAGTAPTGYLWGYAKGTSIATGQLTCMSGVATEYTEGSAYSTAQKAAVLKFEAIFIPFE